MRLLHTSDWHLGQHFMGRSRQAEHQALIDWLLQQVQAHQVDAVLIAGDVFDTGAPASYARELYNQLIARLHQAGVGLLILGGNHDSVSVLDESRDLLRHLGTQVIASTGAPQQHAVTLPLRGPDARRSDPHGASQPGCIVCALPFIRARDVQQSQAGQSAQDKQLALQTAIQSTYRQVYEAALDLQQKLQATLGRKLPIIATGHLTTVGASSNESVREIYVGSLEAFPTNAFPPADYIALGHIHQPQKVGGMEHIRYSGSPIALGFDEARQTKQVLLVELNESGLQGVTSLPVPVSQAMAALRCTLADLPNALKKIAADADPKRATWLDITIEEDDYLADLPARVQALVEELPVQVLRIKRQRGNSAPQLQSAAMESLDELTPQDVFARRLALETLEPPLQQALTERYRSVVESLSHPENLPGSAA
ncbi:exonuclease subunit SbcD [Comamonas testosteroni]|uniref:Nuclease SbcCD subunit D n=1 Tax=Comamonas testosteroni (strain DSM 14576 / KF-1) TaxID=399795 RepID=B7WTB2_COMTK|nr:exonuclease subunit SbcD [Comamonas testosteroni]EED65480.1 nuclease SbcCD, D subunit [Comamonas testosteroni KF-1]WQG68888.1 exonuclease subunit SbcD [Comamonas testosteroni]